MKRFIISAFALTIGLSSCTVLDLDPLDRVSQADYFKTASQLELFTDPYYNNMLDKSPYDAQSDLLVNQTLSAELLGGSKRDPATSGGWSWGDLRRIHTLLAYVNQCPDEAAVTKYTAVSKFFRAFFYFEKVKRFGDVPWYDRELGSADPALFNPRDSRELILTNMIKDIDAAIEVLSPAVDPYRVNKWSALALKAQFCLYEGTYRKYHNITLDGGHDADYYLDLAAKAAKTIIDEGPYKLYTTGNPTKDYLTLFAQENASKDEYILAIRNSYTAGVYHNATAYTLVPTQGRPGYTKKMINMYLMKNGTAFTNRTDGWQTMSFIDEVKDRDPRLAQSIRTPGYTRIGQTDILAPDLGVSVTGYQPIKFVQDPKDSGGQVDRNDRSTCDMPVYRYAEVLLNYAEAKAELGTLTQDDINISIKKIRDRVDMPNLDMDYANTHVDRYLSDPKTGFSNVVGNNKGVILEIRRERAIELAQECSRYEDLIRWKAGNCIDQDINGMYFPGPGEYDLSGDGEADVVLYPKDGPKPDRPKAQVYELEVEFFLTGGNRGYTNYHYNAGRTQFNEGRDYLYPIPTHERQLNNNLTQNPGWKDGLSF